jgi:hypothetical protein
MYRQFDGYPKGLGQELVDNFGDTKLTNGISTDVMDTPVEDLDTANGIECLAAQVIARQKKRIGDVYMVEPGSRDHCEEYLYTLEPASKTIEDDNGLYLRVYNVCTNKQLYDGPLRDYQFDDCGYEE